MKTKKNLCSIVLASTFILLFLIRISPTASASIAETQITTHGTASHPDIDGNKIVWEDTRNGNSEIYALDLSTNKETQITDKSNQYDPAIYGNKVVWLDIRDKNIYSICMYDLSTHRETPIVSGDLREPTIYGNTIVYNSEPGIMMYDLSTKQTTQISRQNGYVANHPAIYGNNIVWEDSRNEDGNSEIYMYNLSASKETQITTSGKAHHPDIYGNKIVWEDNRNVNGDIYMYDLSTKKETQITTNSSNSENPVIYGNNVVWQDNRNGNWNIYAYDLITHQQIHTTDKSDQVAPAIYSNKIVWVDNRNGNPDIYTGIINYLPVAAFSASTVSGKAPLSVTFIDKSTDAYYWSWNFGDKITSTAQNPVHKYTKAGNYTASLTVKNTAGVDTKTVYIIPTI